MSRRAVLPQGGGGWSAVGGVYEGDADSDQGGPRLDGAREGGEGEAVDGAGAQYQAVGGPAATRPSPSPSAATAPARTERSDSPTRTGQREGPVTARFHVLLVTVQVPHGVAR